MRPVAEDAKRLVESYRRSGIGGFLFTQADLKVHELSKAQSAALGDKMRELLSPSEFSNLLIDLRAVTA